MVFDKKISCSEPLELTLDTGTYTVEAKVGNDTKEEKFTIGGGISTLLIDMTTIKKEDSKEELIKADSEDTPTVQTSEKITIGDKQIEIHGLSPKDTANIKELGAFIGALGGMVKGLNSEGQQDTKQSEENAKVDKEFDEMSKELDMFTK